MTSGEPAQKMAVSQQAIATPADAALSGKIQQLRSEMEKPSPNFDNVKQICSLLEQVLSDKGSINLLPNDIIGDSSNYDLKYIGEITINNHKQRIVQFQIKEIKDAQVKPFTYVYAQSMGKYDNTPVQKLYNSSYSNKFPFVSCNVLSSNNDFYVSIVSKSYGSDISAEEGSIRVSVYTFAYDGTKWIPRHSTISDVKDMQWKSKHWKMSFTARAPEGFCIENEQADSFKGNDFVIKVINNKMDITLVDKNNQSLGNVQAIFENGQWKPE